MAYETVIFDWDGCLAMTLEVWLDVYKAALGSHGIQLEDSRIMAVSGDWKAIDKLGIPDVMQFRSNINKQMAIRLPEAPLYSGAKSLLTQLNHQGVRLGLVTSSEKSDISKALSFHGLEEVFASLICGDDVEKHKPHPESIIRAIKELRAIPDTTIMIGDSTKDILAATRANIDSVLIYHDGHTRYYSLQTLQESQPTHTFYSFDEVEAFLRSPGKQMLNPLTSSLPHSQKQGRRRANKSYSSNTPDLSK